MNLIIRRLTSCCVLVLLMLLGSQAGGMIQILPPVDPAEVPRLIRELGDSNEAKRQQAAADLGRVNPSAKAREAIGPLVKLVQDPTCSFRVTAAGSLATLEATTTEVKPAVAALVRELRDGDAAARKAALDILAALRPKGGVGIVPAVQPFLQSKDSHLRHQALLVLWGQGKFAAPLVPALTSLLSHPDEMTREYTASALGSIGSAAASAVPKLIKCLKDDYVASIPIPPMTDTGTPVYAMRLAAAEALEAIGTVQAMAAIKPLRNAETGRLEIKDFVAR
jgi:HEAT repeat protein